MAGINLPSEVWQWWVGIGKESTYGTGVAPTVWFKSRNFGLSVVDEVQGLGAGTGVPFDIEYDATRPRARLPMPVVSGSIEFEVDGDDIGWLLEQMFGQGAYAVGGDSEFTHTFTLPTNPTAMPDSLTIVGINDLDDLRYNGCVISAMEFNAAPDDIVTVTCEFVGQTGDTASLSASNLSTAPPFEFYATDVRYDSVGTLPDSADNLKGGEATGPWSLRIERALRTGQATGDGARGTREPILIQPGFSVMLTADKDWFSTVHQAVMFHTTLLSRFKYVTLFLESNVLIGISSTHSLEFRLPAGLFLGDRPTNEGGEVIPERIRVKATYDGASSPLTAILTNATDSTPPIYSA